MENDTINSELYFLMAKFLKNSPCENTFKTFLEELEKHDILPTRYDWTGDVHKQTFEELEHQYDHISSNHLLDICKKINPLLNSEFKKSITYEPSLLGNGNHSVLRSKETEKKYYTLKNYIVRRHLVPPPEPVTFRKHNIVKVLYGREASGPLNRKHVLAGCPYKNLQQLGRTLGHLSAVYCVLFDNSGRYIFTGADDLLVKVWHAVSGRLLATLRGASAEIADLAVNYENTLLAAGSNDKMIRVWCLQTAFPVATLAIHTGNIASVHFCPAVVNGCRYLTSTANDGSVAFWKYATNDSGTSFEQSPVQFLERMRPGCARILCGSFSPGGMFFAAGSADHNVRVYKMAGIEGPTRVMEKEAHSDHVDSIQWAHSHLKFASGSRDGTCLVWYYEQQEWKSFRLSMSTKLPGTIVSEEDAKQKLRVTMLSWDKSDQWVITACSDNSIKVWDSVTGNLVQILNGHRAGTYVIESHPLDSKILLSAGHDGKLFIWNIINGEILASFQNTIEGQGYGAIFDAKWSPDGNSFVATDSHGHLLTFGFGLPDVTRKVPRELFFHTDYRPLTRDLNNVVLDEQTQTPPHLMPPPFLVDMEGNPYPPYLQRLVPGRELCNIDQLVPNVLLNDDGRQEVIAEAGGNGSMEADTTEQRRSAPAPRSRVGMRRIGDIEGVRQSSGNWQRGDNISWTKRLICEPLDVYSVEAIAERTQMMASIELEEYRKETKKSTAPEPKPSTTLQLTPRRRKALHTYRTRASRTEQVENPDHLDSSSDSLDENVSTAHQPVPNKASSSGENDSSSDYSDWTADHGKRNLEPPKRVARVSNIRRAKKITKITKRVDAQSKKPVPQDIPEKYRPSEWLAETIPKRTPYYPQMGDEVMFFQQGYNLYLNAVQNKKIYKLRPAQLNPWGRIKLKEPQLVKIIGIKYEISPYRLCGLRLAVMSDDDQVTRHNFDLKYHYIPGVVDFLVLRQLYDNAMNRNNWKAGDRFRSLIDDEWWCGKIISRNKNAESPFQCYKISWDSNENENLSPWDLEPLDSRRPQNGQRFPISPREWRKILYQPETDEWPVGDQDTSCERILQSLKDLMSTSIAEHFLAPVDISVYPTYAYYVEYPIDLSTIKARFENRFYRRLAAAQFDARYIASNAEKFNERGSDIVKHARIITDILLRIIKTTLPLNVPALCRQLKDNYASTDSTEDEEEEGEGELEPLPGPSSRLPSRRCSSKRNPRLRRSDRARGVRQSFDWTLKCEELLDLLWNSEDGVPFRQPVDRLEHPDYDTIIDTPIDLSIVRKKLKADDYDSPYGFWKDLKIMFSNANTYTPNKRTRIYAMTLRLSSLAEEHMKSIISAHTTASRKGNSHVTETPQKRGLKRGRRAGDTSVSEESSDNGTPQPSTSTACTNHRSSLRQMPARRESPRKPIRTGGKKIKPEVTSESEEEKNADDVKQSIVPNNRSSLRRMPSRRESPRKPPYTCGKKIKPEGTSESEEEKNDDNVKQSSTVNANRSPRSRTLRTLKTSNYAETMASNSEENDEESEGNKSDEGRLKRQRASTDIAISKDSVRSRRLNQNSQVRHYVENSDSCEDDDDGVNISVSVSSRGRIRKLTAKARASFFRN